MLAQAEFCPSQIGTIKFTVDWTIEELGLDAFEEGDVVLHNDPYRGSGHVPEHMLLKPVFWEGELVAFVANVAHMSEVGREDAGRALRRRDRGLPGGAAAAAGEDQAARRVDVDDVWKIILSNHRTPRVDARRLPRDDGLARPGRAPPAHAPRATTASTSSSRRPTELMAIAERRMRAEIEAIPDGVYTFADAIEDDGITDRDYPIELTLTIDGGERDRRLHGLGAAGGRPGQRDLRRHGVGDLQRVPAPDRPDDPAQRGLLPAVHGHRAARHDRELLVPGAGRRRQHRDEPADHRHGLRRAPARDPRAGRRVLRRHLARRSSSAASTRARTSRTRTSTSRASAGAAARASTATTWSSRSTATAATRRSRCSRRATRRSGSSRTGSSQDSGGPGEFRGGLGGERVFTVDGARGDGERAPRTG